jgi:hypothetical protein
MADEESLCGGSLQYVVAQQDEESTPNPINTSKRRIENIPKETNQKIRI